MKKWLIENFLPMWAKETVLAENRKLLRLNKQLNREVREMSAYINGLEKGMRNARRSYTGGSHNGNLQL